MQEGVRTHQGSCDCDRDHRESGEGGGEGAHPLLVGPLAEPAQQLLPGEDDVAAVDTCIRVLEIDNEFSMNWHFNV